MVKEHLTMWKRFLLWMRPHKRCKKCCMTCEFYEICKGDFNE